MSKRGEFNPETPAHVPAERITDFDMYNDPAFHADPHAVIRAARDRLPNLVYARHGGHWIALGREAIEKVLSDDAFTANKDALRKTGFKGPTPFIPAELDPPEHSGFRAVLLRHLGPKQVREMEPFVRSWAERLIEPLAGRESCDFSVEVAQPMPVSIFMEIMGLPLERYAEFRAMAVRVMSPDTETAEQQDLDRRIQAILAELIEARRREPRDDLISKLLAERVDGRPLTAEEMRSICHMLFIAGLDTVANAMGFGMRHLAADPGLQARIRQDPSIIPSVVEDLLRRYTFITTIRFARRPVELDGVMLQPGDGVRVILWGASNDDANPDGPRQYGFGFGPHICLGMYLARLEMRVMYETWFAAIGDFERGPDPDRPFMHGGHTIGITSVPLKLRAKAPPAA
jgi:cytochrome P450